MVANSEVADSPPAEESTPKASESGSKKKGRKSKSGDKKKKTDEVEWTKNGGDLDSDEDWAVDDFGKESPSVWDPKQFDAQTGDAGDAWKDSNDPNRVQDLPSPALVEPEEGRKSNGQKGESDIDSMGYPSPKASSGKGRRGKSASGDSDKFGAGGGVDSDPAVIRHSASQDDDGEEIGEDGKPEEAWKMRDSWKSSAHTTSSGDASEPSKDSKEGSSSRRARKKDKEPAMPRRSRGHRPDADEETDGPPSKPKTHGSSHEDDGELAQKAVDEPDRPQKPKRRSGRRGSKQKDSKDAEQADAESLEQGSFHKLAKDFDKRSTSRSGHGRKVRTPTSGSGRRRRVRDKAMDNSGHDDDDVDEFGEEEHEIKLKGDDDIDDDDDEDSGGRKMSWRERRSQNRQSRERSLGEEPKAVDVLKAPGSGGRRPPSSRRAQMRRTSSERWMRTVEDGSAADVSKIQRRARNTLIDANAELSRSAHSVQRYHSGGVGRTAAGLDRSTYHGLSRTPTYEGRRTPRRVTRTPDSVDSGGSFGEDYESYEMNLSGRSQRTLDSIEDLEDFEHIDFQTPGMIDYNEEILELMQRANPEHTAQLERRVHRKRDAVDYDQDMPMMTRQALMTRQIMRQVVDGSDIDPRRMKLLRSDSMSSMASNDELSQSQHRQLRGTPGRRPPPRTKSSGMAAISRGDVPGFMNQPPRASEPDDRRRLFRTKSSTTTHSFQRYQNKPNRVSSIKRRPAGGGDQIDPHSMRGTPSSSSSDRRGTLQRSYSTSAMKRPSALERRTKSITPTKPERRVPKSIETKATSPKGDESPELKSDSDEEVKSKKKPTTIAKDEDTMSEDSDVDSDDEPSPKKAPVPAPAPAPPQPPKRKSSKTPTKASPTPKKKSTNKRDFAMKNNRRKLHSLLYEAKMGVDMKDLFKQVQKGEAPKSPIKTLMMPSP